MDSQNQNPQDPSQNGATLPPATPPPASPPDTSGQSNLIPEATNLDDASHRVAPAPVVEQEESAITQAAGTFTAILGGIFSWLIFPAAVVLILHNFVFQAYHVLGTSMVNTLHDTDYLIVSKIGYTESLVGRLFGKNDQYIPGRGQIVVFRYPREPSKVFVKRVVGLPGDRIVIKNGSVTIFNKANPNGFNPDTTYESKDAVTLIDTDETVQDGHIFVMGDNRTAGGSFDSREWGELPSSYIIGNAVLRLLPLYQIRTL